MSGAPGLRPRDVPPRGGENRETDRTRRRGRTEALNEDRGHDVDVLPELVCPQQFQDPLPDVRAGKDVVESHELLRVLEPMHVLGEMQHEHLLLLGIPVGAKSLEDSSAELEPDRRDVDLAVVPGNHTVVEVDVRGVRHDFELLSPWCASVRARRRTRRTARSISREPFPAAPADAGRICRGPVEIRVLRCAGRRKCFDTAAGTAATRGIPPAMSPYRWRRVSAESRSGACERRPHAVVGSCACGSAQCSIESRTAYCPACSSPKRSGTCGCCTGSPDSSTRRFCSETYAMYVDDSFSARR